MEIKKIINPDYDIARTILGPDFIAPEEIQKVEKITYEDAVLQRFSRTIPSEEILQWLHDNEFILIAGPPSQTSLLEISRLNDKLFYYKKLNGWYEDIEQLFSRKDKVNATWLMLRKTPFKKSVDRTWDESQNLIPETEYLPNVPEITWAIATYKELRDIWLFINIAVRTSSFSSGGARVVVNSSYHSMGISVGSFWDYGHDEMIGFTSARKQT